MDQSKGGDEPMREDGPKFYGPADELPPGAIEALKRRTTEDLQTAADRATRTV